MRRLSMIAVAVLLLSNGCRTMDNSYQAESLTGKYGDPQSDLSAANQWENRHSEPAFGQSDGGGHVHLPDANRPNVHLVAYQQEPELQDQPAAVVETVEPTVPAESVLSLEQLEQMALTNNPTMGEAAARLEGARGNWLQVGLYPNPVIGYQGQEMGDDGTAGQQGGFVGQKFITGRKLRLNREAAAWEVQRAEQELEAIRLRVLTDVRTGFYDVLVAQRRLDLTESLVKTAEEATQTAEILQRQGEGTRVDLLQARVEANTTRILLENARNRHEASWRRLAAVAGTPDMPLTTLSGDVEDVGPPLNWEDALARLLAESPELAAASANAEAARWATERARVEWIPNVGVQTALQHNNANGDDTVGVQVSLPLPLFDRNQGNIVAADAQLVAAERSVERVGLGLQNRLAEAFRQYSNARQQVEKYSHDILPDAKTTLDLVTSGYQQGEFDYLNFLTAQRTYFQSNLAYLESLLDLKLAQERIEGFLLSESLNVSPGPGEKQ